MNRLRMRGGMYVPPPPPPEHELVVMDGSLRLDSAEFARLYGNAQVQDILSNWIIGTRSGVRNMSHRFQAVESGHIDSIRVIVAAATGAAGYSGGTGGTIRARVYPDDGTANHRPDLGGTVYATGTHAVGLTNGGHTDPADNWPLIDLTSTTPLVAGDLYHVYFDQTDADPSTNYASIDMTGTVSGNGSPNKWVDPINWGCVVRVDSTWIDMSIAGNDNAFFAPGMQVHMASGTTFGCGDMEGGNTDGASGDGEYLVSAAANPIRERYTPSENKTVIGMSFDTCAQVAGDLLWEVKQGSTVLASGTITESPANFSEVNYNSDMIALYETYHILFDSPLTFTASTTYDVQFTPQGASEWLWAAETNGTDYGFTMPAGFSESSAEHFRDGTTWVNANHWNWTSGSGSAGNNWRVVLHLAAE